MLIQDRYHDLIKYLRGFRTKGESKLTELNATVDCPQLSKLAQQNLDARFGYPVKVGTHQAPKSTLFPITSKVISAQGFELGSGSYLKKKHQGD